MADFELLAPGGHQKLVDEVLDRLDLKADIDGYYAQLTAGAADNLTGRGDATAASFLYRTAGGTADIENGQAVAKSIKGNTLVWNQLVNGSAFPGYNNKGVVASYANGKYSISGTTTEYVEIHLVPHFAMPKGHKFLFLTDHSEEHTNKYIVYDNAGSKRITGMSNVRMSMMYTADENYTDCEFDFIQSTSGYVVNDTFTLNIFDLTQMFGAGNEPSTVAEFEALFPEPYYEYDTGSLLSVNTEGIETVGFNLWDEEWEVGYINESGAEISTGTNWKAKNLIKVFPNTTYYFKTAHAARLIYYDANGNFIKWAAGVANQTFTTGANVYYIRFFVTNETAYTTGTVCINLSWSGRRNGEYEPFWSSQRLIDVATYFPDGMRSAGSVRDELTSTEAITRVGEITFDGSSDESWTLANGGTHVDFNLADVKLASSNSEVFVGVCDKFASITPDQAWVGSVAGVSANIASNKLSFSDGSGSMTVDAWKTWLASNPVTVHYAVATPTTTPIDPPLNLSYRVDDFGTERVMVPEDERSAPPVLDIAYGLNVVDFVRRAPSEYISAASFRQYLLARDAHDGTTTTMTWDDTDNRYEFAITDNVTEG